MIRTSFATDGNHTDWVLVADDAAQDFSVPGR